MIRTASLALAAVASLGFAAAEAATPPAATARADVTVLALGPGPDWCPAPHVNSLFPHAKAAADADASDETAGCPAAVLALR